MEMFLHPVTPANLSSSILALCQELVPGGKPEYVDVRPIQGAPVNECFPIVHDRVLAEGGASVCGWSIGEQPTLFVEAEPHAVWRAPNNELIDVTPKKHPTMRILFLVDPSIRYEGRQFNNVRRAIRNHPAIVGFLKTCDEKFEFWNRGQRAYQHGEIIIQGEEAIEYEQIRRRKAMYSTEMLRLHPNVEPYDPCWCGSGKKVKWCHGVK
ncbi:MAG: SEC-C domain-containing protein [Phycisphaerae bacterium]